MIHGRNINSVRKVTRVIVWLNCQACSELCMHKQMLLCFENLDPKIHCIRWKSPCSLLWVAEEDTQCVSDKICSWQRCLWRWITEKICFLPRLKVFNTQIKVNCLKLFAYSSVQSITLCNWEGLQQQVEQCHRSRSVEQKNWSWGHDIYAIHVSSLRLN